MKKIPMQCVRGGAVRVLLALILGLLVVSGYVVAPILFAKAGSAHEAGRLAGEIFHVVNLGIVFMAVAVAAFWLRMQQVAGPTKLVAGRLNWGVLIVLAALAGINEYGVAPILAELKLAAGPIDQLAEGDPLKARFGMWHGVSAVIHLISTLLALVLLLAGAHRGSRYDCEREEGEQEG